MGYSYFYEVRCTTDGIAARTHPVLTPRGSDREGLLGGGSFWELDDLLLGGSQSGLQ